MNTVTNLAETSGSSPPAPLSSDEKKLLSKLEQQFVKGSRAQAEALREIREKKLYREDFSNFDEYVLARWAKTKPWVTQNTNWLRVVEWLEQSGKPAYRLSVKEANYLVALEKYDNYPDLFIRAMEEAIAEASSLDKPRTAPMVKAAVHRQIDFVNSGLATYEDFLAALNKQQEEEADKARENKRRELLAELEALNSEKGESDSPQVSETPDIVLSKYGNETDAMGLDQENAPAPSFASRKDRRFTVELTGDFADADNQVHCGDSEAVSSLLINLAKVQLGQGGTIRVSLDK